MKLGIRGKLVGTLVLAGLLPLALALGTALYALHDARSRFVGQSFRAMARQQAEHLSVQLQSQVEFLRLLNQLPATLEIFTAANSVPPLDRAALAALDSNWSSRTSDDPLLRSILDNDLSRRWQAIQREQPRLAEVIITDAAGRLIAATNLTSDYYQADEPWWIDAHANGKGRVILGQMRFDETALGAVPREGATRRGANVVDLAMPITPPSAAAPILGVMKASLDATWFISQVEEMASAVRDEMHRDMSLVRHDGLSVLHFRDGVQPAITVPEKTMSRIRDLHDGYFVADDQVIGFTRLVFPGITPIAAADWYFVVTAPKRSALAPSRQLMWLLVAVGLPFILITFVLGVWIARREILRPIVMLDRGATELEKGNLDYRLATPGQSGSVFRDDELGSLAADFNRMAAELSRSIEDLQRANRVKQQFIDLASHELRTPVAYILGATELALRQTAGESPLARKIAAKAKRLHRIVENMFKLLQGAEQRPLLSLAPIDPNQLFTTVSQDIAPFLKERNQSLQLRIQPLNGDWLADADMLRDILDNLLSNAVRFSPDGSTVILELADRGPDVELSVSDEGPGIPQSELPYIFQPFYTGPSANLERHTSGESQFMSRGIGLGLSVVKRFTEMHAGSVSAHGNEVGMTFRVRLPKNPPSPDPAAQQRPNPPPAPAPPAPSPQNP